MRLLLISVSLVCFEAASPVVLAQSTDSRWVPYSASYSAISTSNGKSYQRTGKETRSEDGSLLITTIVDGQTRNAQLWQACGQVVKLDYANKQASIVAQSPRRHSHPSPDAPVGSMMLTGVRAIGYPVHMQSGSGTVWVDVDDDIVVKLETHVVLRGQRIDETRMLSALDLDRPIDPSLMKVPPSFKKVLSAPGVSMSCLGN